MATTTRNLEPRAAPSAEKGQRVLERMWTPKLMKAGWTALPSIILEKQRALDLSPLDVNIILHIAKHWWNPEKLPYPSKGSIADAVKVEPRTVQRRIARLEARGLVERRKRVSSRGTRLTNHYALAGLIAKATPYAEAALLERARHKKEKAERIQSVAAKAKGQ